MKMHIYLWVFRRLQKNLVTVYFSSQTKKTKFRLFSQKLAEKKSFLFNIFEHLLNVANMSVSPGDLWKDSIPGEPPQTGMTGGDNQTQLGCLHEPKDSLKVSSAGQEQKSVVTRKTTMGRTRVSEGAIGSK